MLILNHNKAMGISFLADLSSTCPKLEVLEMDLLYHNTFSTSLDSEPRYETLLEAHQKPKWPASLKRIELLHLRQWRLPIAEMFFSSVAEHAEVLTNLRYLKIKASLGESDWRARSAFRGKWELNLERIFLRKPSPTKQSQTMAQSNSTDESSKSIGKSARRSLRNPKERELSAKEGSSSDEVSERSLLPEGGYRIQGRCDFVDIKIDNLRPAEDQKHESDFLDEELDGDGDWNGPGDDLEFN